VEAGPHPAAVPDRAVDLVVVGHLNLDILLEVGRLPGRDRTVPALSRRLQLGGTAANLALAAARWGVRTALVSRVGPDYPAEFEQRLRAAGIDLRGVERVAGVSSSACVIVHDARGDQFTVIDQGPMASPPDPRGPEPVLVDAARVHLTTGDPGYLRALQRRARARGIPVAVDPAQEIHYRWSPKQLAPYVADAEAMFGNEAELARAARLLRVGSVRALTTRVPLVVLTRGARGSRAYFRGGQVDAPAVRVRGRIDPTGAGDAFRGGFYAGWFAGEPLGHCLRAGSRAAATWLTERRPRGPPPGGRVR
jgi:sugar/nucleoside kinase (ribokinase family)